MHAQPNYDENAVPEYTLPDALITQSGGEIETSEAWEKVRRAEVLRLFQEHVYGRFPADQVSVHFEVTRVNKQALEVQAIQKQVVMHITNGTDTVDVDLLIYLPTTSRKPVPLFVGLNFYGNHTIHPDTTIPLAKSWLRNNNQFHIRNNTATDSSRGVRVNRWPVAQILKRGYGLAAMYYGDLDPDFHDGFKNGIHALIDTSDQDNADARSAISAWAFGLSKAMDYFVTDDEIDHHRIAVIGHSRLGKSALWAGATDNRFAMVVSNCSGCGGAALSRRKFGETVEIINTRFPHWFCKKFRSYNGREETLPVDQHQLIGLMAPRLVCVGSASEDLWADPKGEFLSLCYAAPVYQLYGFKSLQPEMRPDPEQPVWTDRMSYHMRSGKHDITLYDWQQYMDFADRYLR